MVSTLPTDSNPPKETPSIANETNGTNVSTTNDSNSSNFLGRVMNYPTVNSLIDTAKGYYSYAKDSNNLIKKSCESIESNISKVVAPVLENEMIKKIEKPIDNFGCRQLDKMEKLQEDYKPQIDYVIKKTSDLVETGVNAVEPIDQYLKKSYLAAPLNAAVNITESIVDKYIPDKEEETTKDEGTSNVNEPGPLYKSGAIAKKLQKEAMSKLSNQNFRDASTIDYRYVVNLIDYAAKNLDDQVHKTTAAIHQGVEKVQNSVQHSVNVGMEFVSQQAPSLKDLTTERAQTLTNEALVALTDAIHAISDRLPENVTNASASVYKTIKAFPVKIEGANAEFYSQLSSQSSERLKELRTKINQTLELSGTLPIQLLQNAQETLYSIYEAYMPHKDKDKDANTPSTPVETKTQ